MKTNQNKFDKFNKKTTLNKELLTQVKGGVGPGHIPTVSGDCNSSGNSCWKAIKDLLGF